jgi:type VI protein secretion system component VasF
MSERLVLTWKPVIADSQGVTSAIVPWLLRLVRVALLVVLFFFLLSTVVALGGSATGVLEKGVLVAVFLSLLAAAVLVHRIGRHR